jgi:hypothetical protein
LAKTERRWVPTVLTVRAAAADLLVWPAPVSAATRHSRLGQRRPSGGRAAVGGGPFGVPGSRLAHQALDFRAPGPGAHLMLFVPGAVGLGQGRRAAARRRAASVRRYRPRMP